MFARFDGILLDGTTSAASPLEPNLEAKRKILDGPAYFSPDSLGYIGQANHAWLPRSSKRRDFSGDANRANIGLGRPLLGNRAIGCRRSLRAAERATD